MENMFLQYFFHILQHFTVGLTVNLYFESVSLMIKLDKGLLVQRNTKHQIQNSIQFHSTNYHPTLELLPLTNTI